MLKFGTDGVRGVANADLTPELVMALGRAAARVLGTGTFLVGRDTRISGPLLQAALTAGLTAEGADVVDLGVLPTPGVATLCAAQDVAGAVISASHNPFPDNGIKLFAAGGRKLADDIQSRLEGELTAVLAGADEREVHIGSAVGRASVDLESGAWYERQLVASLQGQRLDGLHVVIDCANGAASAVAPRVLRDAGARVDVINDAPDGTNINAGCGSNHPEGLQAAVLAAGAGAGLAFDGDADRVIGVDDRGEVVDGDHLLALLAADLRDRGRLSGDTVVVTVMTNLGFRLAMAERGIDVVETQVGDRYVLEALEAGDFSLGGEQSGHVIFRDLATTGDGILTGLQLLDLLGRSGRAFSELAAQAMTRLPQVLRNVKVVDRAGLEASAELWASVAEVERELGNRGRVVLRPSGTEPLVRVMVEAGTAEQAAEAADRLVAAVEAACAAN